MKNIKNISTALSVATSMLLGAYGSDSPSPNPGLDSNSGPTPVANIKAPELVAVWDSGCVTTQPGATTITQASGGW